MIILFEIFLSEVLFIYQLVNANTLHFKLIYFTFLMGVNLPLITCIAQETSTLQYRI